VPWRGPEIRALGLCRAGPPPICRGFESLHVNHDGM